YALRKEFWHRGIATEAGKAVTKRLANLGIPYITATHDIKNPRSGEVMKKLGMTYRYTYEEQWQPKNIPVLFRLYQLNFDGQSERVFRTYWDRSSVRFVEKEV
ncbi:MAG TPA: GNAT family N-acetyltransferase, partial [Clostridiales bacterium]|nr:GNAT family N-acetyltransferase [Clostridiales bacterium]